MSPHHLLFLLVTTLATSSYVFAQAKPYPSNFSRSWQCPNRHSQIPSDYFLSNPDLNAVTVLTSLADIVPSVANISNAAVILVKRDAKDGTPKFKYYGNGHQNFAIETWSCSKIFSAMNGAGLLASQCGAGNGLTQSTKGVYGMTPLGALITVIVTYDTTHPAYSSNALGGWFEMVGGRTRASELAKTWMNRPGECLGANYGATPPTDLSFDDFQPSGCSITPDSSSPGSFSNTLSALTMAEFVKRAVMSRELPEEAFPNTTWSDSEVLLYGAQNSMLFPGLQWGGMSANDLDFLRLGINALEADSRSGGQYRTFSKDGGGYSFVRDAMEVTFNGYACYPVASNLDDGVEYFVSTRVSIPGKQSPALEKLAYDMMHEAMEGINQAIYDGKLV